MFDEHRNTLESLNYIFLAKKQKNKETQKREEVSFSLEQHSNFKKLFQEAGSMQSSLLQQKTVW